jgi:twinkle protein
MEINGFEIEEYNVYGLDTRKKTSPCPKCSPSRKKKKQHCLMIDWDRGLATCQHCGEVLQLHTYKSSKQETYVVPQKTKEEVSTKIESYFKSRGISKKTLSELKVGEGVEYMPQVQKKTNVILFNYFYKGELINIKYRDAQKNFKLYKGAQKTFYNIDSIKDNYVVVVEGEVDALSYHEAGVTSVVSVPNGFNSNGQVNLDCLTDFYHCFEDLEKIYIAVDQDQAGENGKKELVRRFGAEKVLIIDLEDCKDANEYLQRHGSEKLAKTLDSATLFPIENVLRVTDIESDLDEFYKNGSKKGYTIGLQEFDSIFSTYTKQFIVVTGFPSSGKSDFVDQMTIGYNMMHGWKTAYASTENVPHYLHVDKLVRKLYGSTPSYEDTKQVAWKKCLKHVNDNFFFIDYEDGFDLDKILRKGEELVKRMGIRCLVIDPYNKIRDKANLSLSITDYTNQYLNKIDDFCKKNDVVTILVAHPTKPQSDKGKLIEPTFYDVKGGGEFYDMSPHGLLVHRNYEENTVMIKVLKVKFGNLGENQAKVDFMWNVNNGRYTKIRHGEPDWDNENWLSDIKNPFKAAKALDFGLNEAKKLTF